MMVGNLVETLVGALVGTLLGWTLVGTFVGSWLYHSREPNSPYMPEWTYLDRFNTNNWPYRQASNSIPYSFWDILSTSKIKSINYCLTKMSSLSHKCGIIYVLKLISWGKPSNLTLFLLMLLASSFLVAYKWLQIWFLKLHFLIPMMYIGPSHYASIIEIWWCKQVRYKEDGSKAQGQLLRKIRNTHQPEPT
jgi:hypothetical protein